MVGAIEGWGRYDSYYDGIGVVVVWEFHSFPLSTHVLIPRHLCFPCTIYYIFSIDCAIYLHRCNYN